MSLFLVAISSCWGRMPLFLVAISSCWSRMPLFLVAISSCWSRMPLFSVTIGVQLSEMPLFSVTISVQSSDIALSFSFSGSFLNFRTPPTPLNPKRGANFNFFSCCSSYVSSLEYFDKLSTAFKKRQQDEFYLLVFHSHPVNPLITKISIQTIYFFLFPISFLPHQYWQLHNKICL